MDRRELRLSRDEKRAAKKGYEEEKRASVPYTRPSYAHYYPASDQSLTNIPAFSQRNWSVTHLDESGQHKPFPSNAYSLLSVTRSNTLIYYSCCHSDTFYWTANMVKVSNLSIFIYFFKCDSRRPPPRPEDKPVASVRPSQSTPLPMMPRQASAGSAPIDDSSGGFPVNCLQKAGVSVQKIVTTTGRQLFHHPPSPSFFFRCFTF